MDAPQNFRTAINGFRREDVVRYLEYLNAKHMTEVNQLSAWLVLFLQKFFKVNIAERRKNQRIHRI